VWWASAGHHGSVTMRTKRSTGCTDQRQVHAVADTTSQAFDARLEAVLSVPSLDGDAADDDGLLRPAAAL